MGYGILPMMAVWRNLSEEELSRLDRGGKEKLCRRMSGKSIDGIFAAALLIVMYFYIMKHHMKKFEGYEE